MVASLSAVFATQVLLNWVCQATSITATKSKHRRLRPQGTVTTNCQSVPHHVLWQKLDLHPSAPHRRPRDQDKAFPVDDEPEVLSSDELAVRLRRRRSMVISGGSRDHTSRSYRRLIRSIESDQRTQDSSNSTTNVDTGRSRRRLRRLRRRLRRQPSSAGQGADAAAAHQCQLKRQWKRMSAGVFPPYVETGRCVKSTCMFGLYECTRRRYALTILRRVPRRCNPLPSLSANTTYEHVWRFANYHVTVGCECARKRRPGRVDLTRRRATTTTETTTQS